MKKLSIIFLSLCLFSLAVPQAKALDVNLINVDVSSPESDRATMLYSRTYGFPPEQIRPVLLGPPEEVPAILQIAQTAGTAPLSIWMMRRMGMSYPTIAASFLAPPVAQVVVAQPNYVEYERVRFLRNTLVVDPILIPQIPLRGISFLRFIAYPIHPEYGYWMPPGIAKKYGYWIPPGQAKKMGLWTPPGQRGKYWVGGDIDDDWNGGKHGKNHWDDHGGGKGKKGNGGPGKGNKGGGKGHGKGKH